MDEIDQIKDAIKKYFMGEEVVIDAVTYEKQLKEQCEKLGIDFENEVETIKQQIPEKRRYKEIVHDANNGLNDGLELAFNELIEGNGISPRYLKSENDKNSLDTGLNKQSRQLKRYDLLRCLCIALKKDTLDFKSSGYDNLKNYLIKKGISSNLNIDIEQLEYIHNLPLNNLSDFCKVIDLKKIPKQMETSTKVLFSEAKSSLKGDNEYIYEDKGKRGYRIYINTPRSDKTDDFLLSYAKMCINKKIPFSMKGDHYPNDEHVGHKDNTVLYLNEEFIQDYLQILDKLEKLYPDTIETFGTPPHLTAKLSTKNPHISTSWYGFSDLGEELCNTYNDRTKHSASYAMICTLCSEMTDDMKDKAIKNGYPIQLLQNMANFELAQGKKPARSKNQTIVFDYMSQNSQEMLNKIPGRNFSKLGALPSVKSDIFKENTKTNLFIDNLMEIWKDDIEKLRNNHKKRIDMQEKFKKHYKLMENYFKYNHRDEKYCDLSFDEYAKLPTTISMNLYEKGKAELEQHETFEEMLRDTDFSEWEKSRTNEVFENKLNAILSKDSTKTSEEINNFIEYLINEALDEMHEQAGNEDTKTKLENFNKKIETIKNNFFFQLKTRNEENQEIYGKIAELYRNSNEILQKFQGTVKSVDTICLQLSENSHQYRYCEEIFARLGYQSHILNSDLKSGESHIQIIRNSRIKERITSKRNLVDMLKYDFSEETLMAISGVELQQVNDVTVDTKKEKDLVKEQNGQEFG